MSASKWVERVSGGDSGRQVAARAGIVQATLSRQLLNDNLTPENVVAIARAYKVPVLEGLVAIGLIRESDIASMSAREALRGATDEDLTAEVLRRIREGSAAAPLTEPISASVHAFPRQGVSNETDVSDLGTVPERAVANEDETLEVEGIAQLDEP
jgi:transcriptional regulator with XRE-family HTH domain